MPVRVGQPASAEDARRHAGEQGIRSSSVAEERMRAHTFTVRALFSCSELLVLIVCAAATTDKVFMMMRLRKCCFSTGPRSRREVCWHRTAPHTHAINERVWSEL